MATWMVCPACGTVAPDNAYECHICGWEFGFSTHSTDSKPIKKYCYWYTHPGVPRWLALWSNERVNDVIVARWVSVCVGVPMCQVDVIRMQSFDRPALT